MDAGLGTELLPPQADGRKQHDHRVEGVPALPWVGGRVGLQAVEDHLDVLRRERMRFDVVPIARVEHQRRVNSCKQAVVDHPLLAAAPLLRRRPEEHDLARELVGDRGEGDRGPDPRGGHRVVAAAVAEAG